MGKSKKQAAMVMESIDITAMKKGKRSVGQENGEKPSKKLKTAGKPKEPEEEVEMVVAEELVDSPPKATKKVGASKKNGAGKKGKKAGLAPTTQAPQTAPSKGGKKALKEESDNTSDSEVEPAPPIKAVSKNGVKATKPESSSEASDGDSSEEEDVPAKPSAKSNFKIQTASVAVKNGKKSEKMGSSSDEDSSDNDEEHKVIPAKAAGKAPPKKMESSSEEDSDDSDDEEKPALKKTAMAGKPNVKVPAKKLESSDDEEDSDESGEEEDPKQTNAPAASGQTKGKPLAKKVESSSDEDESDESEELDAEEEKLISKTAASDESDASDDEDEGEDDEDEDDEDEDDEVEVKSKSAKKGQEKLKTPAPRAEDGGSKTVFVKNLAWGVDEDILQDFFESVGEVEEVRLSRNPDGRSRGFGHVDFSSTEAAKKACKKSGEVLEGRDVFVELAKERLFSPGSEGRGDFKSPRGGGFSGSGGQRSGSDATAFVRGFNKFQDEDSIRTSLSEFFAECGVQNVRLPTDRETGNSKGFAYVDFSDRDALAKAIEYSGSDLDGRSLFIEEAGGGGPSSGGGGRGRGRGDFGGRGRGDFGGRGGRAGRGDFGGRGGRGRGSFGDGGRGGGRRGGRGFGGSKANLSGSGKKTTFGDD
ncbi:hypothetical protein GOP47_0022600 [Adiantum capillus-veneris]|uniref:RRM domain-containing protein n=1 Tax=Adiantum capillus-veneris TaxID=13818 RepID=A0A9D4U5P3_ADICA|nr:hypothetical protein GOP47_0022600 [Adiantum capillus-veneris]